MTQEQIIEAGYCCGHSLPEIMANLLAEGITLDAQAIGDALLVYHDSIDSPSSDTTESNVPFVVVDRGASHG